MPINIAPREELGDGLTLSFDSTPPAARFRIGLIKSGALRWSSGNRTAELGASTAWWLGPAEYEDWSLSGDPQGFWLTGNDASLPKIEPELLSRLEVAEPRPLPQVLADMNELLELQTNCLYQCELKTLLVRGKALMIVSKVLHALGSETTNTYDVKFYRNELDLVREARQLMVDRMTDPPNLGELARLVGLNELKLKAGFRQLWGTTVFGMLRRERMLVAKALLSADECNVSEAAFRVGYTNISHFARAFRNEFGVPPGSLARRRAD